MADFDGDGTFQQIDSGTIAGETASNFTHTPANGKYTVNADCTGTFTIDFTDGRPPVVTDFVVVEKGSEIDTVVTSVAWRSRVESIGNYKRVSHHPLLRATFKGTRVLKLVRSSRETIFGMLPTLLSGWEQLTNNKTPQALCWISCCLTVTRPQNRLLITDKETLRAFRGKLEAVSAVTLSLDQDNFSASQAKRSDGEGLPSAAVAGQPVTPEAAASLPPQE
jgi:hypothetical protein